MARLVIQNGRVIDPSQSLDDYVNLVVEDGKVAALGAAAGPTDEVWDASGKLVVPGLIDLHAELREPGFEEDETIATGTAAALRGGFATIACLPNTDPPIDSQASVEFVHHQANRAGNCNVVVLACVSKNREGHQLAEIGSLVKAGAVGFTDASAPIHNAELMRRALDYCQMFDRPVMNHPEVLELTRGGIMHDGSTAMILGLAGLPPAAEDVMASRDLRLAEATGGRLHLMNISSEGNVDLLRRVKSRGVTVTADINVANFTLTDEVLRSFDTNCKLNPPLRSRRHVQACIEAIADGTIDAIASGHTPRAVEKKMRDLSEAPFGMVALETALSLVVSYLVEPEYLNWSQVVERMSAAPARILGLRTKGTLQVGADADITVIDPELQWKVDRQHLHSRSFNSPFLGQTLKGRAVAVFVAGLVKYIDRDQWPS